MPSSPYSGTVGGTHSVKPASIVYINKFDVIRPGVFDGHEDYYYYYYYSIEVEAIWFSCIGN